MDPVEVSAACNYRTGSSEGVEGTGVITRISRSEAVVDEATLDVKKDVAIQLFFRIFETSTHIRVSAKVTQSSKNSFTAEFNMDPALRNILRMALGKLKVRGKAALSKHALMTDVRSPQKAQANV